MDFGVVFQLRSARAGGRRPGAARPRTAGFSHVWTFDSHLLWQEPYVIYSQILGHDRAGDRRPDGDQPGHPRLDRDRVTFATLNEMYGNRTICGIGRGDSALRTLGAKPGRSWPS